MRKTFLKVALIGLLAAAMPSTFTSCKDYDDDITNLTTQTNDLKTQLASVNAAIAALPTKADVSAAQAAAVAQAKSDLEAVKAQLEAAIAGKADKATVDAIQTELSTIKGQLEAIEALKGDMTAALEAINGSITELQENAVTKGQMDAALEAQKAELDSIGGSVATLVTDVEALKAALDQANTDNKAEIDAIKKQLEELAGKIGTEQPGAAAPLESVLRLLNGMITHIEVVGVGANEAHNGYDNTLNLYTVTVAQDLVFGQGYDTDGSGQLGFDKATFDIQNKEVFKKGDIKTFSDSILIRVSPANAVVTADQIQLVNTQGADLNDFVQITSVEAYKGLLTATGSRSIANNGLHVVKFALKEGFTDVEGFAAATNAGTAKKPALVKFAVAVADSEKELAEGREITSAYDLVVNATPNEPQYALDYDVVIGKQATPVSQIRNRFRFAYDTNNDNSSLMFPTFKDYETQMSEVYAKRVAQNNYYDAINNGFTPVGDFAWVENAKEEQVATYANSGAIYDNRTYYDLLEVKLGQTFTVDMSDYNVETQNGIYGFYVTLDMWRATESNGSEREAWRATAPSIEGINAVTTGSTVDLTISKDAKVDAGEVIGFRVYAVNFDGTLVDPDGRAFYVVVDQPEASEILTASATISAPAANSYASATVDGLGDWTATVPRINVSFATNGTAVYGGSDKYLNGNPMLPNNIYVVLNDGKGNTINNGGTAWNIQRGSDGKGYDVLKKIRVVMPDWQYADGETYSGVLTITDAATELVLQTINVEIVKNVANNAPTGFGINTNNGFPAEGDLTAVVTDPAATYDINTIFNWGRWNNTNLTSSDYTEVVTFQGKTDDFAAVTATAAAGIFDLSTVQLQNRNNAQNFNANVINNGKYPMAVTYEYATAYSYVKDVDAQGNVVMNTWNINGKEIKAPRYVAKAPKYTMSRNISFVTIASQLSLSWKPASGSGASAVAAYNPSLTYNTAGEIDLTKVVASQTITSAAPWKNATVASLVAAGKITNLSVVSLGTSGLGAYYTASIDGDKIVLTPKANAETPMSNVSGTIKIKFNDDITGSSAITLNLPSITMNK